jgi:hypothetical protein
VHPSLQLTVRVSFGEEIHRLLEIPRGFVKPSHVVKRSFVSPGPRQLRRSTLLPKKAKHPHLRINITGVVVDFERRLHLPLRLDVLTPPLEQIPKTYSTPPTIKQAHLRILGLPHVTLEL